MTLGRLEMTLPDGTILQFGLEEEEEVARFEVKDPVFFKKCVLYGDVGFGESYMHGDWTTDNVTKVIQWMILNIEKTPTLSGSSNRFVPLNLLKTINRWYYRLRPNDLSGSKRNVASHYDLNNAFFQTFLDKTMTYSSAYFSAPNLDLEQAQYEKYENLCQMTKLTATDHVLEIGAGWGGFAIYAAKKYGCKITTVTISKEQFDFAQNRIEQENLSHQIKLQLLDYRKLEGTYDKIISIEMLEAVGAKYLNRYFQKCHKLLKKDGILGLQVIVSPDARYHLFKKNVDWIQKHIFPGSLLPSIAAVNQAINQTGEMFMFNLKDMGLSYAQTLAIWRERFNQNLDHIQSMGFDESFIRKWNYYFCYCEAAFTMRNINVVQMVYSRPNNLNI